MLQLYRSQLQYYTRSQSINQSINREFLACMAQIKTITETTKYNNVLQEVDNRQTDAAGQMMKRRGIKTTEMQN